MNRHQQMPNHIEMSPAPRIASRTGAGMYVVSPLVCPVSSTSTPVRGELRSINSMHSTQITHPHSYQVNNCTSGYVDSNVQSVTGLTPSFSSTNARFAIEHENMSSNPAQLTTPSRDPAHFTPYFPDLSENAQEIEVGSATPRRIPQRHSANTEPQCFDDEVLHDESRRSNEKPIALAHATARWSSPLCTDTSCKVRGNPFSPPAASYSRPTYDPMTMRRVIQATCPSPNPHYASAGVLDQGLPFIERLELNWLKFRTKPYYHYRACHTRENSEREAIIQRNSRKYFEWLNSNQSSTNPCASPALFAVDQNANAKVNAHGENAAAPDEYLCDYLRTMSDAVLLDRDCSADPDKTPSRHCLLDFATTDYSPALHPSLCKPESDGYKHSSELSETKQKRSICTQTAITVPQDIDLMHVIDFYLKKQAEFDRDVAHRSREQAADSARDSANDGFREPDAPDGEPPAVPASAADRPGGDTPRSAHVKTCGNSSTNGQGQGTHSRRSRSSRNAVRPRKLYHGVDDCDEQSNEAWHSNVSQNSSNTSSSSSIETVKVSQPSSELAMNLGYDDPDMRYAEIVAGSMPRPAFTCTFSSPVYRPRADDIHMCDDEDEVITGNGVEGYIEPQFDNASPFGAFGAASDRFSSPCPAGPGPFSPFAAGKSRFMATPNAHDDRFTLTQARNPSHVTLGSAARRTDPFSAFRVSGATSPGLISRPIVNACPAGQPLVQTQSPDSFDISMTDGATLQGANAELFSQPAGQKYEPKQSGYAS